MKFVRAEIKLTSPGMTDSKTFGPFFRTFKRGLEFIAGQYNGKKRENETFFFSFFNPSTKIGDIIYNRTVA